MLMIMTYVVMMLVVMATMTMMKIMMRMAAIQSS